jgi:hypothetical protein
MAFKISGVEFVYIKSDAAPGYAVLAKRDFNASQHALYDGPEPETPKAADTTKPAPTPEQQRAEKFVRIKSGKRAEGYVVLAKDDFNPATHELFVEPEAQKPAPAPPAPPSTPEPPAPLQLGDVFTSPSQPSFRTASSVSALMGDATEGGPSVATQALDGKADEAKAFVLTVTSVDELQALRVAEAAGKSRKTVLDAIDNRIEAVLAGQ